ncbi:MAG: YeeE/YedE thiosulfate transporter family protein [Sedimentisphaeraceae bacterium JB056]
MYNTKTQKTLLILVLIFLTHAAYGQQDTLTESENIFQQVRWSPYAVGAGIGILSILTFSISNEAIGVSGAFARTSGMIEKKIRGNKAQEREYYKENPPKINWEWMFVLGLIIGSFISAILSGDFEFVFVPDRWQQSAGDSQLFRWLAAFIGGILMGFGARWARGCTSGHGISGTLQLAVSSWIATMALFASGIITAMIIFHWIL